MVAFALESGVAMGLSECMSTGVFGRAKRQSREPLLGFIGILSSPIGSNESEVRLAEVEGPLRWDKFLAQPNWPYPRLSSCSHCANKYPNMPTCHAFLGGIPLPILAAEHDHRTPYEGDFGIRYEPDPGAVAELKSLGWL